MSKNVKLKWVKMSNQVRSNCQLKMDKKCQINVGQYFIKNPYLELEPLSIKVVKSRISRN